MKRRSPLVAVAAIVLFGAALTAARSARHQTGSRFPTGTFVTKITAQDLVRAGLPAEDAHRESITYRSNGTWRAVWSHPRVAAQPPEEGRYAATGDRLRVFGTPDLLRWRYAKGFLTFSILHVPDKLARLTYTAHPWRKTR